MNFVLRCKSASVAKACTPTRLEAMKYTYIWPNVCLDSTRACETSLTIVHTRTRSETMRYILFLANPLYFSRSSSPRDTIHTCHNSLRKICTSVKNADSKMRIGSRANRIISGFMNRISSNDTERSCPRPVSFQCSKMAPTPIPTCVWNNSNSDDTRADAGHGAFSTVACLRHLIIQNAMSIQMFVAIQSGNGALPRKKKLFESQLHIKLHQIPCNF